ncbi:hypothetical protein ACJMK2_029518 [Sinanodonta woodiana]|uniref:Uncharacterized protein n=1 Tax=Sinanodonta woodiana TaxID=1069815 RepID=A0ABD3XCA9_SINWO
MWMYCFVLMVIPCIVSQGSPTISRCVADQDETLIIKCPEGQKILVTELIFGLNPWGACGYTTGDCTEAFDEVKDTCCGQPSCPILVKKFYSQKCQEYVNFFRLVYECVLDNKNLCSDTDIQEKVLTTNAAIATIAATIMKNTNNNSQDNDVTHAWRPKSYVTMETTSSNYDGKELVVIVGSGAAVAVLVMAIITVLFLLRRFSWDDEKYCIMGFLIPKCLQRPPNRNADGSEDPEDTKLSSISRVNEENHDSGGRNAADSSTNVDMLPEANINGGESAAERKNPNSSLRNNVHAQFLKIENNEQILLKPNKDRKSYESRKRKTSFNDSLFVSDLEVINEEESAPGLSVRKPRKHLKPRSRKQSQSESMFEASITTASGLQEVQSTIENKFKSRESNVASGTEDKLRYTSNNYGMIDVYPAEQTTGENTSGSLELLNEPVEDIESIESKVSKPSTDHSVNICDNLPTKEVDDQNNHCVCFYIHDGVGVSVH